MNVSETAASASISVVIPVYNSETILPELVARLKPVLDSLTPCYELILINDGSLDNSWEVINRLVEENDWVSGIDLLRNYGQENALLAGVRVAKHEIIVTMDDDLQHPPEEIPSLVSELQKGHDVVYGPPLQEQHALWRNMTSRIFKLGLQKAIGVRIARDVCSFRAFRSQVCDAFAEYQGCLVSIDVLLSWGTTRFAALPVRHEQRQGGISNYTFGKLVTHAINVITGFGTWPLRMVSLLGLVFSTIGFAILVFVFAQYFIKGRSVPGFAFLASMIAIFSGAQLFAVGIIGHYLAWMHYRIMQRPPYVIRSSTRLNATNPRRET